MNNIHISPIIWSEFDHLKGKNNNNNNYIQLIRLDWTQFLQFLNFISVGCLVPHLVMWWSRVFPFSAVCGSSLPTAHLSLAHTQQIPQLAALSVRATHANTAGCIAIYLRIPKRIAIQPIHAKMHYIFSITQWYPTPIVPKQPLQKMQLNVKSGKRVTSKTVTFQLY